MVAPLVMALAPSIIGGVAGWWNNRNQAKAQEQAAAQAGETANQGFNYLAGSPAGTQYAPAGGAAVTQQANLLGIGDDPAAAEEGYQNYLRSTGHQAQLEEGSRAITTNRAAAGLLGSGSTGRALTRYGQDLGRRSFDNYFARLQGVAQSGFNATGMIGQAATAGGAQAANAQYGAGVAAAGTRASGVDQLIGGFGGAWDAYQAHRGAGAPKTAASSPAAVAPTPRNLLQPVNDNVFGGFG